QGDALAIVFELDDLDADLLSELDDFLGIGDAAAAHLRNVEEPVDAAEVDEGAEGGDGLDSTFELGADGDGFARLLRLLRGGLLEQRGAGDDDAPAVVGELGHAELVSLADELVGVLDLAQGDLREGTESAEAADVD